jgi:type I restriction enzyme M protein
MLPMTVLRRFDCVLASTKEAVLAEWRGLRDREPAMIDFRLNNVAADLDGKPLGFHNHSELDFQRLKGDPDRIADHLVTYIDGFSENVRKVFERFDFGQEIERLNEANRLYEIVSKFAEIDLHPSRVDNVAMGHIFEDLIRRFNEAANETAGDHFTPREVIRLMVNLLLEPDSEVLTQPGKAVEVCDPACGTGGMLSETQNWIREHNERANVFVYGQDYNPRSYAIAASDLLMKGQDASNIRYGNTLTDDQFKGQRFDYLLANPPFGVDWKAEQKKVTDEHNDLGYSGRFGPKLPRVNDGALLFLLHMISKFEPPEDRGSRCAIVFNGSPLFTGGAGSGESEIRRWIIENDRLEAIVALPEQMFYNTGIGTFVWVVTNRKVAGRAGKIQLIDARERGTAMRRSLGDKRRYLTDATIDDLTREHGAFQESETSRIFDNADFGYRRITVERPLRLRFQITEEAKEQFLDAQPEFLDAVRAMERALGRDAYDDWNAVRPQIEGIAEGHGMRWTAQNRKLFRQTFTTVDPEAQPVIAKRHAAAVCVGAQDFPGQRLAGELDARTLDAITGWYRRSDSPKGGAVEYEPDPALRDFENVPLKEDIVSFFLREVRPYVADAWIDRETRDEKDNGIGKVGYEINFNREFFRYEPPRPLEEIDAELAHVEGRILKLLQDLTT